MNSNVARTKRMLESHEQTTQVDLDGFEDVITEVLDIVAMRFCSLHDGRATSDEPYLTPDSSQRDENVFATLRVAQTNDSHMVREREHE